MSIVSAMRLLFGVQYCLGVPIQLRQSNEQCFLTSASILHCFELFWDFMFGIVCMLTSFAKGLRNDMARFKSKFFLSVADGYLSLSVGILHWCGASLLFRALMGGIARIQVRCRGSLYQRFCNTRHVKAKVSVASVTIFRLPTAIFLSVDKTGKSFWLVRFEVF